MVMVTAVGIPSAFIRKLSFLYFNDGDHHTFGDAHKNVKMRTFVMVVSIALGALIVLSIVYTIILNIPQQPKQVPESLKIMSFNIRQGIKIFILQW